MVMRAKRVLRDGTDRRYGPISHLFIFADITVAVPPAHLQRAVSDSVCFEPSSRVRLELPGFQVMSATEDTL